MRRKRAGPHVRQLLMAVGAGWRPRRPKRHLHSASSRAAERGLPRRRARRPAGDARSARSPGLAAGVDQPVLRGRLPAAAPAPSPQATVTVSRPGPTWPRQRQRPRTWVPGGPAKLSLTLMWPPSLAYRSTPGRVARPAAARPSDRGARHSLVQPTSSESGESSGTRMLGPSPSRSRKSLTRA